MRPNGILRWLLTHLSSSAAAEATIGDVLEELQARCDAGRPPRFPRAWISKNLLTAVAAAIPTTLRCGGPTVRDAWRTLRRAPLPSLFILLILAVAISAATVMFSVVDAVVLRPLPFDHSARLVVILGQRLDGLTGITVAQFEAIRSRAQVFDSVGLWGLNSSTSVTIGGAAETLGMSQASSDVFRVLRISPIIGRIWSPSDEAHRLDDVAVISERLWRDRFGSDEGVVGQVLGIASRNYEIIGVLPNRARSIGDDRFTIDVWVPYSRQLAFEASSPNGRLRPLARLNPGVSVDEAARAVNVVAMPLSAPSPRSPNVRLVVRRWDEQLIGDARSWLLLLLAAVGLMLAIACVNVANMRLTQATERARDLAVRASLGASGRQLAASVLLESLMLSFAAGAAALLFSTWGITAAKSALPPHTFLFRENAIGLNARVLWAGAIGSLLTGLLFGAVPAWQASRTSVAELLKDAGAGSTARRGWRSAFLVTEVGSVAILLVVSALYISSFVHVMTLDLGFDRSHLVAVPRLLNYRGAVGDLKARLASLPGVTGVAAAGPTSLPLVGAAFGGVWVDTPVEPTNAMNQGKSIDVIVYSTTPDLFDVAGMKFLRGTTWTPGVPPTPRPIVIDEIAARELFGTANPVGQLLHAHDIHDWDFNVVGVVPYAYSRSPDQGTLPSVYYAAAPNDPPASAGFLIRTAGSPTALVPLVEDVTRSVVPPRPPEPEVHVVDDAFRVLTATWRFNATLMSLFALFALVIGAAGVYAVMASIVAQQTKEIGVRVALGATGNDIRRDVLNRTTRHVLAGLVLGLPAGWLISRGFVAQFFQVKPTDASIYLIVATTLSVVAIVAAIVPARRAAKVDPVVSLRTS